MTDQKEKCESKTCIGSQALKKIIDAKVAIINTVALTAVKLNETKSFAVVNEILKILCGEVTVLTPVKENRNIKTEHKNPSPSYTPENDITSPKQELPGQVETYKDESVLEIDGTPGRVSPIIALKKKFKNSSSLSNVSGNLIDSKDKKKCPVEWSTPETKQIRLNFPSPNHRKAGSGRMRQSRLDAVFTKATSVVDLTNSSECAGSESLCGVKLLIKKESSDNDDTILPSPTSGPGLPVNFLLSKTDTKENNQKFKKPISLSRTKTKIKEEVNSPMKQLDKNTEDDEIMEMEHSINILQYNRYQNRPKCSPVKMKNRPLISPKKSSPKKESKSPKSKSPKTFPVKAEPMEEDITHFDDASISILQQVEELAVRQTEIFKDNCISPTKGPLVENINVTNISSTQTNVEDSISILQNPKVTTGNNVQDNDIRKTPEKLQPVYKELLPRKKAEKQALPAWLCDECKDVLNDLYANDPEKVARIVARCSKHRGKTNPIRPKTPPGFWYPRWEVPEDTEEFNRRNNVES
ncbi:uncharacterized protein LOC113235842 isoform X2 [Hyposmocoma kahamanoa]|nr:uncharacterized protein LOC113235842 isoform X2 [Hyposmocoma kahamanoa]